MNIDQIIQPEEDPDQLFEIQQHIGKGSSSTVFRARNRKTDQQVAIKVIPVNSPADILVSTVNTLKIYEHKLINKYHGAYYKPKDSKVYIVSDCQRLLSLKQYLKKSGKQLSEVEIAQILYQVLQGLVYLHDNNKYHQNLKISNVLLDHHGNVKLGYFGMHLQLSKLKSPELNAQNVYWQSPEILKYQMANDKTDSWGVGILAVELAEGRTPYATMNPYNAATVIKNNPTDPFSKPDKWSKGFKHFVEQCCLLYDPSQRKEAKKLLRHPFITNAMKQEINVSPIFNTDKQKIQQDKQVQKAQTPNQKQGDESTQGQATSTQLQQKNRQGNENRTIQNSTNQINQAQKTLEMMKNKCGKDSVSPQKLLHQIENTHESLKNKQQINKQIPQNMNNSQYHVYNSVNIYNQSQNSGSPSKINTSSQKQPINPNSFSQIPQQQQILITSQTVQSNGSNQSIINKPNQQQDQRDSQLPNETSIYNQIYGLNRNTQIDHNNIKKQDKIIRKTAAKKPSEAIISSNDLNESQDSGEMDKGQNKKRQRPGDNSDPDSERLTRKKQETSTQMINMEKKNHDVLENHAILPMMTSNNESNHEKKPIKPIHTPMHPRERQKFLKFKESVGDYFQKKVSSFPIAKEDFLLYLLDIFSWDYSKCWREIKARPHAFSVFAFGFYMYEDLPEQFSEKAAQEK